jgi:hypothetical protein
MGGVPRPGSSALLFPMPNGLPDRRRGMPLRKRAKPEQKLQTEFHAIRKIRKKQGMFS